MMDKWEEKEWEKCKKIILEDAKLKEIDMKFYELLDTVESSVATKLEDAYLDYGARVIELAYEQGRIDAQKQSTD